MLFRTSVASVVLAGLLLSPAVCENTPCTATWCDPQPGQKIVPPIPEDAGPFDEPGRQLLSRYPLLDAVHRYLIAFHDVFALGMLAILIHQWLVAKYGSSNHKKLGSVLLWVCSPLSILPAWAIVLYWRPKWADHTNNNFPNDISVRIIGVYGSSFLVTTVNGLVKRWLQSPTMARMLVLWHVLNTLWVLETHRFIHAVLWSDAPHDSKQWKICAEMSIITLAFALWEPYNLYILCKYGAHQGDLPRLQKLDWVRHHRVNMMFLTVMAFFAPSLFLFHDTYWLFIPANGFGPNGLTWPWRTAAMLSVACCSFLPNISYYVEHLVDAWRFRSSNKSD